MPEFKLFDPTSEDARVLFGRSVMALKYQQGTEKLYEVVERALAETIDALDGSQEEKAGWFDDALRSRIYELEDTIDLVGIMDAWAADRTFDPERIGNHEPSWLVIDGEGKQHLVLATIEPFAKNVNGLAWGINTYHWENEKLGWIRDATNLKVSNEPSLKFKYGGKPAYVFAATSPEEVFERIDLDTMIPEHKEILRVDGTEIEKLSSGLRYSQDEIKMLETMQVDNEHLDHPAFPNLMVDVYDDVNQLKANKAVFSTSPVSDKLGQYDVSLLFVLDAEKPQLSSVVGQIVKHPEFGDTNPPEVLCEAWAVCSVSKESVYLPVWTQDEQVSVKAAAWAVVESLSRQAEQQLGFDFSVSGYKTSKDCLREEYAESIYEVMDWVTAHYEKSDTGLEPLPHPSQLEEVAHGVFRWQNESEYFEISAHDEIWVGKTNLASQNANIPNTSVANTFGQAYAKLVETCSRQLDESSPMLRIANPAAPDSSYDSVYSLVEAEGLIEPTRDERFLPGFKPAPHSPRTPLSDIKPVVFRPKTDGR